MRQIDLGAKDTIMHELTARALNDAIRVEARRLPSNIGEAVQLSLILVLLYWIRVSTHAPGSTVAYICGSIIALWVTYSIYTDCAQNIPNTRRAMSGNAELAPVLRKYLRNKKISLAIRGIAVSITFGLMQGIAASIVFGIVQIWH